MGKKKRKNHTGLLNLHNLRKFSIGRHKLSEVKVDVSLNYVNEHMKFVCSREKFFELRQTRPSCCRLIIQIRHKEKKHDQRTPPLLTLLV